MWITPRRRFTFLDILNFSLGGNVNIGTYAFSSPGVKSRVDKIKVEDEKKTKLGGGGGLYWTWGECDVNVYRQSSAKILPEVHRGTDISNLIGSYSAFSIDFNLMDTLAEFTF